MKPLITLAVLFSCALIGCERRTAAAGPATATAAPPATRPTVKDAKGDEVIDKVTKSNEEWKKELTSEQYNVLRDKGTERAFTGEYSDNHEKGIYRCSACGLELFDADTKFESGTGWPSFY